MILGWTEGDVTPEVGQTTTIFIYAEDGTTLINTIPGLTGTSYDIPIAAFAGAPIALVKVGASRTDADGSFESLQNHGIWVQLAPISAGALSASGTGGFSLTGSVVTLSSGALSASGSGTMSGTGVNGASANLALLLNFEGANGSTTFTDESPLARSPSGLSGSPTISTAQHAAGSASLSVPGSNSGVGYADRVLGSDFTVDLYFRASGLSSTFFRSPIGSYEAARANTWCLWVKNTPSSVLLFGTSGGLSLQGTTVIGLNTWYHVRICRSGSTLRMFLDGVLEAKSIAWGSQIVGTTAGIFYVGKNNAGSADAWSGFVDRVAIEEGLALSTSDSSFSLPVTY